MNKIYHIYVKNECVYHSLSKEDFDINNILDEPDSPVVSRRNMKPPLSRKN